MGSGTGKAEVGSNLSHETREGKETVELGQQDTLVINETDAHDRIRNGAKGTAWRHISSP
jgi:hypothetical protein